MDNVLLEQLEGLLHTFWVAERRLGKQRNQTAACETVQLSCANCLKSGVKVAVDGEFGNRRRPFESELLPVRRIAS